MGHRAPHTEVGDGDTQTRPVRSTTHASFLYSRQVSAYSKTLSCAVTAHSPLLFLLLGVRESTHQSEG